MADPGKMLYSLEQPDIEEIKISPGIMLLVLHREENQNHVPLKVSLV